MIYRLKRNRVWRTYNGGSRIDKFYGVPSGLDSHFSEDWIASTVRAFNVGREAIEEGISMTDSGKRLVDLFGNVSVLVKLLDADERLIIQVHPTVDFAKTHFSSNYGKTECWYILETDENAHVYLGFRENISRKLWITAFEQQNSHDMLSMMHKINVNPGECFLVEGGIPHAIGGGCLILEIQEPTDFMVVPERYTPAGLRLTDEKMHCGLGFDKMFDCFIYEGLSYEETMKKYKQSPKTIDENRRTLVDVPGKFKMEKINAKTNYCLPLNKEFTILIVMDGKGFINDMEVNKGDHFFITGDEKILDIKGPLQVVSCMPG